MQALVLCGGQGTRLRSVIGENQKTMTKIGNVPFLVNVVNYLKTYKITNIIFATGYKSSEVKNYFGPKYYFGVDVSYSEEKIALGTGGAIRHALDLIKYDNILVLNGDTLFKADLKKLEENFKALNADMSIACKSMEDKTRYGTIDIDFTNDKASANKHQGIIKSFDEKVSAHNGEDKEKKLYINGGIYILKKELVRSIPKDQKMSLEKELIPRWLSEGKTIGAVVCDESFVDIGTPESLKEYKTKQESEENTRIGEQI